MKPINNLLFTFIAILLLILSACTPQVDSSNQNETQNINSGELKKFSSKLELNEYLENTNRDSNSLGSLESIRFATEESMLAFDTGEDMAQSKGSQEASEYSETNIQVEGVDEADIVKNDGKYIYTLSGNKIVIVDAYPAETAEILSEISFDEERVSEFFLNEDQLIIFTNSNEKEEKVTSDSFVPREVSVQYTNIYTYDISNKEEPTLDSDYSISGSYYDARFIDGVVYIISTSYINYYRGFVDTPVVREEGRIAIEPEIFYFDVPAYSYNFHTVASLNIETQEINADTYMLGGQGTLYVSKDNMYLTHQKYSPYINNVEVFEEVVLPLLPQNAKEEYLEFENSNTPSITNEALDQKIIEILEKTYNSMSKSEKENLIENIEENLEKYYIKKEEERQYTQIHKLALNNGEVSYESKGEVKGNLLNQFSLDEYNGNLRIATTTNIWNRASRNQIQYNNVYVLDENLNTIGELEELAEDERIYSARFMGDKLYLVTFRQIDPLFVISLENPENPEVLGELKIPGFSSYLHPLNENFIIGVGSDTKESQWGGIVTNGVKLSLFDVSDVKNPKEVDTYIIEGRYTSTPVEYEHKAFLFNRERELLVLPITEIEEFEMSERYNNKNYWQGAYVFTANEQGFELRGTIDHGESENEYSWRSPREVKRSLFMDNVLYTISEDKIMMNDIKTINEIGELDLEYEEPQYYGRPIYY